MSNRNPIFRELDMDGSWVPMSATALVGNVEISTPPSNAANVLFRGLTETGEEVTWVPGEFHKFTRMNLTQIEAKGTAPDIVTVVGEST